MTSNKVNGYFIRRLLINALFLFIIFFGQAAEGENLLDIFKFAQDNDPTFQRSVSEHIASRESVKQAWSNLLPTLSASAEYTLTDQDVINTDNPFYSKGRIEYDTETYSLKLTQPIFQYSYIVGLQQAKVVFKRSDVEFEIAKQDVILRVAELYFNALLMQDNLAFIKAEQDAVEFHLKLVSERYERGLAPITDLYDAKARMATVVARTAEAKNELDDAFQALHEVGGKWISGLANLKEKKFSLFSPVPANVDFWVEAALKQHLELSVQRLTVKANEQEVRRQRSGHYPTLELVGRINYQETDGTMFGGGSEVQTADVLLRLNIPIFQGGIVSSKTREAASLHTASLQDLTKQHRAVVRQVRAAYSGVITAITRVNALQQSVASQELALEAKQEGFKSGLYASLEVLDAERDLYMAKRDYAQASYDYILNILRLKQLVGSLSEEDIVTVNQWLN